MSDPIVRIVRLVVAPLSRTRAFRSAGPVLMPKVEAVLDRLTGGRVQVSGLLVPTLVLRTIGAKSGQVREGVLMYTPDGLGRAIIAGTNFAGGRHPAWTANLDAHPEAQIVVRGRVMDVVARRIPDAERDTAWHRIEAQWPGYRSYERSSGRVVKLYRLHPVRIAAPTASNGASSGAVR